MFKDVVRIISVAGMILLLPDTRFKTRIALDENYCTGSDERSVHPNRSVCSLDNGKTWDFDHLGEKGMVDDMNNTGQASILTIHYTPPNQ